MVACEILVLPCKTLAMCSPLNVDGGLVANFPCTEIARTPHLRPCSLVVQASATTAVCLHKMFTDTLLRASMLDPVPGCGVIYLIHIPQRPSFIYLGLKNEHPLPS